MRTLSPRHPYWLAGTLELMMAACVGQGASPPDWPTALTRLLPPGTEGGPVHLS